MKLNHSTMVACIVFATLPTSLFSQSSGPEFLSCSDEPISLCVQDEGVRLPANNQIYLGETHPDATSGSVHMTLKMRVRATCGSSIQYEVAVALHDTSELLVLKVATSVELDAAGEAELVLDTEEAVDEQIRNAGFPYVKECNRFHRMVWTATDSCGNQTTCEIRIRPYDCSPPVASGITGPVVMLLPAGCLLNIWAKDLIVEAQDDQNTSGDLLFSLSPAQSQDVISLETCTVPAFGTEIPWNVWVADGGQDGNCDGKIDWNERQLTKVTVSIIIRDNGICCCLPEFLVDPLSGHIRNAPEGDGIELVHVSFQQEGMVYPTFVTDETGFYTVFASTVNADRPLTIRPERDDNHKRGVSTIDMVKIQKHLLGIEPLTSPYKLIAADANQSGNVSAIDLVEIRKIILGVYVEFPIAPSWQFVREDYVFPDTLDPWYPGPVGQPDPWDEITITQVDTNINYNFIGVKTGDVTGAWDPNFTSPIETRTSRDWFRLWSVPQHFTRGQVIEVPVFIREPSDAIGFQFTLTHPGLELASIRPGQMELTGENVALFEERMTLSWFDLEPVQLHSDAPLFTFTFIARSAGSIEQFFHLSSDITPAEWYSSDEKILQPTLDFPSSITEASTVTTMVSPNPWTNASEINCTLPGAGEVRLDVTDALGRLVHHRVETANENRHVFQVTPDDLPLAGQYFFTVTTTHQQVTGKMIRIE